MTDFEKLISNYTDAEQYFNTAGFYHVANRASQIETRKLIDEIVNREGCGKDLQKHDRDNTYSHTLFTNDDGTQVAYAIPRHYYSQKDGDIEVNRVEVVWLTYKYAEDEKEPIYPTDETENILPITEQEESRLIELALLSDNARKDFEAIQRTAINSFLKKNDLGVDNSNPTQTITAVRDLADGLIEAVTMQDAEALQEIQYRQITQHWQIVDATDGDTRNELIRFFCTKHYDTDEKTKARQLACVYSNFASNIVTAIPDNYLRKLRILYNVHNKDEEKELFTLALNCSKKIEEKKHALELKWFYEVGGEYVKDEAETTIEDEAETLQRFAESEAVYQDYTSPTQQIYSLTKASRGIFDGYELADDITELDNGQLEFIFAVTPTDAKTQKAVILDIADTVKGLTKFDKSVLNAVFSIIEAGNTTFTSKQVAIQNTQNKKPRPNAIGAYTKSIKKLQTMLHKIDVTEHLQLNGVDLNELGVNSVVREGYVLPVEGITITMNNGTKVEGYKLIKNPILLDYSKDVKQIHTVDNEVLDVPVNKTEQVILMRDYLIQQIGIIYNAKGKVSNNILISTVLDYAGFDLLSMDRRRKKERIEQIITMLEYWEKIGYIENGYKLVHNGKTLEKISIIPRAKDKKR